MLDTPKPWHASSLSNQLKHQNNTYLYQDNMIHDQIQHKNSKLNKVRIRIYLTWDQV